MDTKIERALVAFAFVAFAVAIVDSPFHAAAYLASEGGVESPPLVPWDGPFRKTFSGAFDFAPPDDVYVTYGRLAWTGLAGMLAAALVVRARGPVERPRAERVAYWLLIPGLALGVLGSLMEYYTPYLNESFMFLSAPGILLTLAGLVTFGVAMRRSGRIPRAAAWTFMLAPLVLVPMIALFGHIPLGLVPIEVAWMAALARGQRAA